VIERRTELARRVLAGAEVLLVGLFSAKDADREAKLALLATTIEAYGARVVGQHVQRRGVSHGGADKMSAPLSRRTLISAGKIREVADACRAQQIGAVVFANPLTEHQRTVLGETFGCTVLSGEDLFPRGG
jgi:50S ribosomal subunit-associated GTPase HflX